MTSRSPATLVGVLVILLLAVMGFNAFSAVPVETTATPDGVVLPPNASGRIAAVALTSDLVRKDVEPVVTSTTSLTAADPAAIETTTTTTASPPTTAAPAEVATTTEPPPTTAAPTTTTTQPPATTTTTTPPSTTAPPPTTPPPAPPPGGAEAWRDVVAQHFPADQVDGAIAVIQCESKGDPNAYNPASGASGLFQFLPATWETASAAAGYAGADVFDGPSNIAVAAWLSANASSPWAPWSCKP